MKCVGQTLFKAVVFLAWVLATDALAQDRPSGAVIFENVRIFDGTTSALSGPANVLVAGNSIRTISSAPIADPPGMTVLRIPGNGRTLMPGLIDNHWHTMLARPSPAQVLDGDIGYTNLLAGVEARATLMRGFTTVRDLGGPSFGLKRAIDEGLIPGPRIYPSGAMITITGGHGDFRSPSELPRVIGGPLSRMEIIGRQHGGRFAGRGAGSRARAAPARGLADQADGGRRRCVAAQSAGRFHLHRRRAAGRGAGGGELGHLRHRARVHAGRDPARDRRGRQGHRAWPSDGRGDRRADGPRKASGCSFQPFTDDEATPPLAPANRARRLQVFAGTERTVALAKKYKLKMAFGTDILFSPARGDPAGRGVGQDAQVVQRAGTADHGDRHQCRTAEIVGSAQSLSRASSVSWRKAHWRICCWSTATRSPTST